MNQRVVLLVAYVTLAAFGCGGSGSSSGGSTLWQQADEARRETDPARRARRLIRVALLQHEAKDTSGSKETVGLASDACNEITDAADRARMLTILAKAQVRLGGFGARDSLRRAEQAIAIIEDAETRLTVQAAWAEGRAAAGNRAGALDALAAVEADAAKLDNPESRIRVLCRAAEGYDGTRLARPEEADRLLQEALLLARAITDLRDRSRAMTDIARSKSRMSRPAAADTLDLALQTARQIESAWRRAHALHDVALVISDRADARKILEEADATAEQVPEPDLRKQTLQMIRQSIDRQRSVGK